MQEAILKVRGELGRDAVILHSKKVRRGGAFGLFGRPVYEVIAAVDLPTEPAARERVRQEVAVGAEGTSPVGLSQAAAVRATPSAEPRPALAGERRG
ncbi:MAG TPA: flagellar biosynthesis protein FlhF, partial [Firmicutes bacterium]|nr:flagellar biosynthesis protein FlhF [Bacillota bacterium]